MSKRRQTYRRGPRASGSRRGSSLDLTELQRADARRATTARRAGTRRKRGRLGHMSVGQVALVVGVTLVLGALFNADSLLASAQAMELGPARNVALAFARPIQGISDALGLNEPARFVDRLLGRTPAEETADAQPSEPSESQDATPAAEPADPEEPAAPAEPDYRTPTAAEPLRLWIGGDSMIQVFGEEFVNMCEGTGVITTTMDFKFSSGLSRPDFFDWPAHLRTELARLDPEVVVIMFGANDGQNVEYEGKVLKVSTPEWIALYHERVGAAMDIAAADGRRVYWVGQPIARSDDYSNRMKIMDTVYEEEAAKRPGVVYIDSWSLFVDQNGKYSAYLKDETGASKLMRQDDGIHLSRPGGIRLAKRVYAVMSEDFEVPPLP